MNNSITLKNSLISQQIIGTMCYVGSPDQILKLINEHKYPTKSDGYYTVGKYSLDLRNLRKEIDNRAAKENKIFYMDLVDTNQQIIPFWFEDAPDIASEYFL